jgi:hypothetical protein
MKAYACLFTVLTIAFVGVLAVAADIPQYREQSRLTASLDAQVEAVFARAEAQNQIVEEVIAGKMTLLIAAEKIGELYAKEPESMLSVRFAFPGDTDKECLCRHVLFIVKVALEDRPSQAETVIPRLESEMHDYLGEPVPGA